MANTKISALSAASTPLAGTEILPIVQSSTTVQVSVNNLTAGKTVSASKFSPTGNDATGNGMYLPTSNTLAWSTNGTERWRIDSSGNLSFTGASVSINNLTNNATMTIGADSGTGAITAIRGASYISLNTYSGGWNECARIGSDGRILIAATSNQTSYKLQVSSTGNDQVSSIGWNQLAEYGGYRTNGASGAQTVVADGNVVMRLGAYGSDGTVYRALGRIDFAVDGTPGSNDMPGRLAFFTTADGAGTSTERARITNAGTFLVGTTSTTANGGVLQVSNGITFPATQSACSNVNTLDDYEEGTFDPTVIGSTSAGTVTYSTQSGIYTKIGNLVFVYIRVVYSAGDGTGNLRVGNLPFTVRNTGTPYYAASITPDSIALTATNIAVATITANTTYIAIQQVPTGGGSITNVAYDAAGEMVITGCYQV